jgi:hypothetical protein
VRAALVHRTPALPPAAALAPRLQHLTRYGPAADYRQMRERDLRPGLDSVQRPALIAHRGRPADGRAPNAPRPSSGRPDVQHELARLEASLDGRHGPVRIQRVLATVLFTDIVDSTARAVTLGDAAWSELLDRHDRIAQRAVADHGGGW